MVGLGDAFGTTPSHRRSRGLALTPRPDPVQVAAPRVHNILNLPFMTTPSMWLIMVVNDGLPLMIIHG